MTLPAALTSTPGQVLVWDASPLYHAVQAGKIDVLHDIARTWQGWMDHVSGQKSNQGEATVLTWAEVHQAVAVVDDQDAVRIARRRGLEIWGSLRVIAESVRDSRTTAVEVSTSTFGC